MTDQHVESEEASDERDDVTPPPKEASGPALAISLGVVASLVVSVYLVVSASGTYILGGMDSAELLTNLLVAMCIAIGGPLVVIIGWIIRRRHLARTGRSARRAPLVTAIVCLVVGSVTVPLVASAAGNVERDAVITFQESLLAPTVEADGVAQLEWMAERLELAEVGEPEIRRESCVLADGSRGVAPVVTMQAKPGGVSVEDLPRVAHSFWSSAGLDPVTSFETTYVTGVPLEDSYTQIMVVPDQPMSGVLELSYHAVCMTPWP